MQRIRWLRPGILVTQNHQFEVRALVTVRVLIIVRSIDSLFDVVEIGKSGDLDPRVRLTEACLVSFVEGSAAIGAKRVGKQQVVVNGGVYLLLIEK